MIPAPTLPLSVESARLRALRDYGALDSPRDGVLDELASLAAQLCGTPIGLVSFVAEERQRIRGSYGPGPGEAPRPEAFCAHAICMPEVPLLVPDASSDPRFSGNPLVKGPPGIRSYAGVALEAPGGHALGTLCVMDFEPRELSAEKLEVLRALARQVMGHLELQRRLRVSEQRFGLVAHSAGDVVWDWDLASGVRWWSDRFTAVFGCASGAQAPGDTAWSGRIHPEDRERVTRSLQEAIRDGRGEWESEYRFARSDGTFAIVRDRSTILRDEQGAATRMSGEMRDITERRESAELLALLSAAVEQTADLVIITDRSGIIQYVNAAFTAQTGFSKEDAVGNNPRIVKSGAHTGEFYASMLGQINAGGVFHGELINRRKNGNLFIESKVITPIKNAEGEIVHFLSTGRDVTERKRSEEDLRSKTALLEAQMNSTIDGIAVVDGNGRMVFQNQRYIELWKLPKELAEDGDARRQIGHAAALTRHPEQFTEKIVHLSTHPTETSRDEIELTDGTVLDRYSSPVVGKDGKHYGRIWTFRDVTAQKRSIAELAESISLLDATLESTVDGIMVVNASGQMTKFNRKFVEMWNVPQEILAEKDDGKALTYAITQLKDPEAFTQKVSELYANPEASSFDVFEFKDGRAFERYSQPHRLGGTIVGRVWSFRDVTERRRLESRVLRTQRMESIGTLAGGIAHDLNNVLTPILISIDLLRGYAHGDEEHMKLIDSIGGSAQRGASLVRQVLTFARGLEGRRIAIDLCPILEDFETLIRETFPRNLTIVTGTAPGLWRVIGDPTQIHQVMLNLAVNSRDAMPGGGTLTIAASNQDHDTQATADFPNANPGKYVAIEVADSGEGIRPEIRDRVFEPFFTTKEVGKGTGLGLATVYAIVKSHGGFVTVASEVGRGTSFTVHLPADNCTAPATPASSPSAGDMPRGRDELILVVDDEASIRNVVKRTLERFGYRVLLAADGSQAREIYERGWREIAVVLTDMMMPVMDGPATIGAVLSINPGAHIIASSGLQVADNTARANGLGVRDFLAKPYETSNLLKLLRNVIDGGATETGAGS